MKRIVYAIIALIVMVQISFANEQQTLKQNFLNKIDEVIIVVQNKALSKDDRNTNIVDVLTPMFDFELMAKLSLGKKYKSLTKEEKKKFIKLYVKRMKKSYSSKIDAYSDEKVEVVKILQPKSNRIELVTDLVSKDSKLKISYKFYKPKKKMRSKDSWLIYDVVILGVSILKTDKIQFNEYLREKSLADLMRLLEK
ncbi:MAG: ABC transporter substrate-binding protein [Campylobacterota bacterium]|nr:ABC transporter substrate-binding protein [Campylobacterota bacterium]